MAVELFIQHNSTIQFPVVKEGARLTLERKGTPGKLEFTVVKGPGLNFAEGDPVKLTVNGTAMFYGFVFKKKRDKGGTIDVVAYDQLRYLKNKDTITEAIGKLYGSGGKGVYEIALAEWYYQNNNCFHALVLVTGTIPLMEQENDMRCLFVALALQMKILLGNGQTRTAKPLVEKIRKRIYETGWEELTSSLNALECLAACYDGRQEDVEEWLEKTAPDENNDIFMMDMYAYLVKVRCYLQTGKYMVAHVLVKQLIALLTTGNRHMDLCECYMLSAIICHKAGDKKHLIEELTKTLELAGKFGYIRLLADEGNSMVQMLNIYQQEKGADELTDQIKLLADEVGRYFPNYLKSPAEYFEPLTATETAVLRLMSQGLSNDEIAGRLGKKTGTVKFHTNNIFRKLQVQNRQQAVNRGREINLL